jgi:DNA-binding transcriptional ArsR family regulator
MVLTELEQIKILADPLRIRILEELCAERTTKQVAQRLGEKPTKLYHHVEALERVGLIALTRTRPNRGTLEKYYQAVARSFRAELSARAGSPEEQSETVRDVVRTIFDSTAREMTRLIDQGDGDALEKRALLNFVEVRAEEKEIEEIQRRLTEVLESLASLGEEPKTARGAAAAAKRPRYRLTLAFYPLDVAGVDARAPRRAAKGKRASRKR